MLHISKISISPVLNFRVGIRVTFKIRVRISFRVKDRVRIGIVLSVRCAFVGLYQFSGGVQAEV